MQKIILTGFIFGLFSLYVVTVDVGAQSTEFPIKEMAIEVQSRVIALPGGESGKNIAKVPIKHARFRNTELRNLNKLYNAVSIERIYAVEGVSTVTGRDPSEQLRTKAKKKKRLEGKRILRKKGGEFFESNNLSADGSGKISADKRVKLKKKKKLKAKKGQQTETSEPVQPQDLIDEESIGIVSDMFIISFQDYTDANGQTVTVDLDAAVSAYGALDVVTSAVKN